MSALEDARLRLEDAAARLRAGELEPEDAAVLVERCAELASELGTELDRRARSEPSEPAAGQERLI